MRDFKDYGDMQESVNFGKGIGAGVLFSAGIVAVVWLMMSF